MPKRDRSAAAAPATPAPEPEETPEATPAPVEPEAAEEPADEAPKPARRGRRSTRVEEGAKSEAGEDMDGAVDPRPDEEPDEAQQKPARRRGRTAKPKPEGDSADVAEVDEAKQREYKFADVDDAEIEFTSLADADDYISAVYYGREGMTKTTSAVMASALTEPGKVLLINAEGGAKKKALEQHGVQSDRVMVWPAPGKRVSFAGLEKLFYKLAADLAKDKDSWLAVIWDSGTEIVQTVLDQVVEGVIQDQEEIISRAKGRAGNIKMRDRFDNDRDDYRKMSNMVRGLVRKFRYLPCHFIMTALLRKDEDEKTHKVTYNPAFTPALQTDILGYMDCVLYCQSTVSDGQPLFYAMTVAAKDDRAKDRYNTLPGELVNPTFDRVVGYIRGELDPDTDPIQKLMPGGAAKRGAEVKADAPKLARAPRASRAKKTEPAPAEPKADPEPEPDAAKESAAAKARVQSEIADKEGTPATRSRARVSRAARGAAQADRDKAKPRPGTRTTRPVVGYSEEPPF
jgi:hypothetical protein